MRFGILLDFRNPPGSGISFRELYADMLHLVDLAEEAGLDSVWLSEHHFTDDGYLPSLLPVLGAIAARTRRISLGTFVLLAPLHHPLRLAEDAAVVDVLSQGRLRLGLGTAYRDEEFAGFGVPRKERLGRTRETIEILKRAWTGERFDYEGKHFRLCDVRVLPRPVQTPHPELLWGGMTPTAIERAAELGLSFACNLGKHEIALYRDALRRRGKDPADYSVVSSRIVYVADDAERAWRDIEAAVLYQAEIYGQWLSAGGTAGDRLGPDAERLRRTSILGSPEEVARRLCETIATNAMTDLVLVMQLPGLEPAKARRSLERFASDVLPHVRQG